MLFKEIVDGRTDAGRRTLKDHKSSPLHGTIQTHTFVFTNVYSLKWHVLESASIPI